MGTALVIGVGASQGVGGAVCRRLAREGLHVVAAGRTEEKLSTIVRAIEGSGGQASLIIADATTSEGVAAAFDAAERAGGVPEVVVYNVGNNRAAPLVEMSLIFTGATASVRARPPFTAFASAKAALRAVAFGMAREFGPQGLHVAHVVIDGVVDGAQVGRRMPQLKERLGQQGMLQPDDIAEAYWMLHRQPRSAWTLELDLRPDRETF